jgi:hypothetical protein
MFPSNSKNDFAPIRHGLDDLVADVAFDSTHIASAIYTNKVNLRLRPPKLTLMQQWTYPIPPPIPTVSELDAFTSCPFFLNEMYALDLSQTCQQFTLTCNQPPT